MSFIGLPPMAGFAAKVIFIAPALGYGALFAGILWVRVVMSAAAYLTASLGALFMAGGTASWFHGFRPTLAAIGLLVATLTAIV